jgi:hypothetical protein
LLEYARAETYKSLALEMDKNNTLSTLEILGMYAETKAEKRKYARKFSLFFLNWHIVKHRWITIKIFICLSD